MADPELRAFINAAAAKGASDRFIADLLKSSGWAEKEIYAAFREHYEQTTGVSLPVRRESGESSRDAFFYLIIFSTLATWTIAVGSLLFSLIDRWFPDPVSMRGGYYPYERLNLSFQLACILVAFPVFILVTRRVNRSVADEPRNRYSPVRKWLTYIALVIAAGVLIGDAVAVLAYFLQGEISLRFISKVFVVACIAGGVFGYYLAEVGAPAPEAESRRRRLFAFGSTALVGAAVLLGFVVTGGPASQRGIQADMQRVRDLHQIAEVIRSFTASGRTPAPGSLAELPASAGYDPQLRDPVSGGPYEYRRISDVAYELCATFTHDDRDASRRRRSTFWAHPAGRHCFQLNTKQPPPPQW